MSNGVRHPLVTLPLWGFLGRSLPYQQASFLEMTFN